MGVFSILRVQWGGRHISRVKLFHTPGTVRSTSSLAQIKARPTKVDPLPLEPKAKIEPFVKNFFLGKIDTNLLSYPELDLARWNTLQDMASEAEQFMNSIDVSNISEEGKLPEEVLLGLKNLGLFGLSIPKEYGGLGLTMTEMTRLFEVIGSNSAIFHALNCHHSHIVSTLLTFGSEDQKGELLPQLASGDLICGFALWEEHAGSDVTNLETSALLQDDMYVLSGSKLWVNNAGIADKFIVFAKTKEMSSEKGNMGGVTCLLVDKHSAGIHVKSMHTAGVGGFDLWEVTFDQTKVPAKNRIGSEDQGLAIAKRIVYSKFTLLPSLSISFLKTMIESVTKHVIHREVFLRPLKDYEFVKQTLGQVAQRLYAIESMAYFNAGLVDNYEDPDTVMEVAITKAFCAQSLKWSIEKCCSLLGSTTFLNNSPYQRMLHDAESALISEGAHDLPSSFIATLGLRHVEKVMKSHIRPSSSSESILKIQSALTMERDYLGTLEDNIVIQHLHPAMEKSASYLHYCVRNLMNVAELYRKNSGIGLGKQIDLARIGKTAVECYVTSAVLARASRSYCLGLQQFADDLKLSESIAYDSKENVYILCNSIGSTPVMENESNQICIADLMMASGDGYRIAHPLTTSSL